MGTNQIDEMFTGLSNQLAAMASGNIYAGLDPVSSNLVFQAQQAEAEEARRQAIANFNSWTWHAAILVCAVACVVILWRMLQLKKKESCAAQQQNVTPNYSFQANASHASDINQEAKQQHQREQAPPFLTPPAKEQDAQNDFSASVHQDSRYMPKISRDEE